MKEKQIEEIAKELTEKVLDTEYEGKPLREWIEQITGKQAGHTEEEWAKAVENVRFMRCEAQLIPMGLFYVAECNRMLNQYAEGDRSDELYEEMINAH
jgi:hypothetical protein